MKIKIIRIPDEGIDIKAELPEPPKKRDHVWFKEVLKAVYEDEFSASNKAKLDLHIHKTCDNIALEGEVDVDTNVVCDRCAETFPKEIHLPIHLDLAPFKDPETDTVLETDSSELTEQDENFAFYKGDEIDIAEIIGENLLLDMPIRNLCKEDCKGLCPQCGQNLNLADCHCSGQTNYSQFSVLKDLFKKKG